MQAAIKARSTVKGKITRVNTFLDNAKLNPVPHTTLETRLEMLRDYWKEYETAQNQVDTLTAEDAMAAQEKEREEQEEKYAAIVSGIKALIVEQIIPQQNQGNNLHPPHINDNFVPKFEMPNFTGNFADWPNFKNVFTTMVHEKKNMKNHQKLHILKLALQGDAARLLNATAVTDENYEESWKSVIKRYDHERQLIMVQTNILLHLPFMKSENGKDLRKLIDTMQGTLRSLKAMKIPTENWDPLLVSILIERFDADTRRNWELQLKSTAMPTFTEVEEFVELHCQALETFESSSKPKQTINGQGKQKASFHNSTSTTTSTIKCILCPENHPLYMCQKFHSLPVLDRADKVKQANLCFNCLRVGHSGHKCNSQSRCRTCSMKHHTLLHIIKQLPPPPLPTPPAAPATTTTASVASQHASGENQVGNVLLATAIVKVKDKTGQYQLARALLDSASEASFITESLVQRLGLKKMKSRIQVTGLSQASTGTTNGMTLLDLASRYNNEFTTNVNTLVLPKVTGKLPRAPFTLRNSTFLNNVHMADPNYNIPGEMDLLLGADCFGEFFTGTVTHGEEGVHAMETVFGWVLTGKIMTPPIRVHHVTISVEEQLRKFWEIEEAQPLSLHTEEEKKCLEHFEKTHGRQTDGRYVLQLPFKDDAPPLGVSRQIAEGCFYSLEKRLSKNPTLKQQYVEFMREYIRLGHMELLDTTSSLSELSLVTQMTTNLPTTQPGVQHYFLPHHEVVKESSTTTKLRSVFNASRKSSSTVSLNDRLMVGPKIQRDLLSLLLGFRTHAVALTADIEKMYRQILIHPSHQVYQLIVWRESPELPLQVYVLKTVTYGESCAPFQAQATLIQLAKDEKESSTTAAEILTNDLYMDDLMSGASTERDAINLVKELITMLSLGGFQLRKWSSNSSSVLESVPPHMRETQLPFAIEEDDSVKTLGLHWSPGADYFSFKVNLPEIGDVITKRTILSDTAKIFDPVGFAAPCIIIAKILLQQLWVAGLEWDDEVPPYILTQWTSYRSQLKNLENLKIPRQIADFGPMVSYQIHGFCDSSTQAYAAVVYLRSVNLSTSEIRVNFVAAKTRVAPVKQISLPRLELCGAVLLTRLLSIALPPLKLKLDGIFCWTDSTVVLAWIKALPIKWKTFVANRVTEIQSFSPSINWHHVKSNDNPADGPSRGIQPSDLSSHYLWWSGPTWLQQEPVTVQPVNQSCDMSKIEVESRKIVSLHTSVTYDSELLHRFSSLQKLKRVTAYLLRFSHNARNPIEKKLDSLTVSELQSSLELWIKIIQKISFDEEIQACVKSIPLPSKSKVLSLHPFLDSNGLLRVGGRIKFASVPWEQKFPIILPKHGKLTELIVMYFHLQHLHAGPRLLLSTLQQQYWILSGRTVVRYIIHRCVTCFRYRSATAQQLMGNLPPARLQAHSPFYNTGLDYAGPILLRVSKGRGQKTYKGYISVFVCMATKAIHLECVSDLTTEAFLAALKRFIARRSNTRSISSDNGTNFVGANKELQELKQLAVSQNHNEIVVKYLTDQGIEWHFIPPSSPHMGGIWEAGVKGMKSHLKKILGAQIWTYEEMTTCLAQIEACLNSRPLSALSSDPCDLTALTPGHFLTLGPMNSVPEPSLIDLNPARLNRWQKVQQCVQQYWSRWQSEVLSSMQTRNKWRQEKENVKVDDLVLIKDDRLPPCKWSLGRVQVLHPGQDGLVRVVTLKTSTGVYQRPVHKLCVLPLEPSVCEIPVLDQSEK